MKKRKKVIIFGSKAKNVCQEQDILSALRENHFDAEIWNRYSLKKENLIIDDDNAPFVFIRNLFYSSIKDNNNPEKTWVIQRLRELEKRASVLSSIDGLINVRDKLKMNDVFRKLKIPHIKTYEFEDNNPSELLRWIKKTSDKFSNGVIIKDRFGGLGKGIVKVKRQGSLYVCDISCVGVIEQKYINETLHEDELKALFSEYMTNYNLIGQPYIKSSHEFNTVKESESIRILDIGKSAYFAMRRIAESPINNLELTKSKLVNGEIQRTKSTAQEREFCKKISDELDLFLTGYDFIRTRIPYYRNDPGSVYIPKDFQGEEEISLLLEVNGLVQYAGIQELYQQHLDITSYVVSAIKRKTS